MIDEIAERRHIVSRAVLILELPGLIVLRILPAPIKFVYFLLRLAFYLHMLTEDSVKIQFYTFLLFGEAVGLI
jgi:hypothetical protein